MDDGPDPFFTVIAIGAAVCFCLGVVWFARWLKHKREFRCSNCDHLLRGEKLYVDHEGLRRCPKCGEPVIWENGLKLYKK
jgi:predicted RNA-binding Zn-ribbon protein involved in translation (DUF1610 family)